MVPTGIGSLQLDSEPAPANQVTKMVKSRACSCQQCKRRKLIDSSVYFGIMFVATLPLPVALLCVAADLDPTYLVAEKYILPPAYSRELPTTFVNLWVRTILVLLGEMELCRFFSTLLIFLCCFMFLLISIVSKICICKTYAHNIHVQTRMLLLSLKKFLDYITGFILIMVHALGVMLSWFAFKCFGKIPTVIYITLMFTFAYVLLITAVVLLALETFQCTSNNMIKSRLQTNFCSGSVKISQRIEYKVWRAEKSLQFNFAGFFPIRKGFTDVFFSHMIDNMVNASLLF